MIIEICKTCGRVKKIKSSKKHNGVTICYGKQKDKNHICYWETYKIKIGVN